MIQTTTFQQYITGADPGFPVGGGANLQKGAPDYKIARFTEKLHEIKKILVRKGGGRTPGVSPLDPPLY